MEYLQYNDDELDFKRDQFTFYRSFYEAMLDIEDKTMRADTYDMVCNYALNNVEPDFTDLQPIQRNTLRLIMPVAKSGKKKALAGMRGGSKTQANRKQASEANVKQASEANVKQSASKREKEIEIEKDKEIEIEYKKEGACRPVAGDGSSRIEEKREQVFDIFWDHYPKKVGMEAAREAFRKVKAPIDLLVNAIHEQLMSRQWQQEDGKYIPNPAKWLEEERWKDSLEPVRGGSLKASGRLGNAEMEAIRRLMADR